MTIRPIGIAIAVITSMLAVTPASAQTGGKEVVTKTIVSGDPAAKAIVNGCGDRHFESSAEVDDGAGHKRVTKIKLCAKPGEDEAAWLRTLRKARRQVDSLSQLPPESRAKLAADFDAEIARVQGTEDKPAVPAPK